jgi:hypothetical protein
MEILFHEEQRMNQWWLRLILLLPIAIFLIAFIQKPPNHTSDYIGLVIFLLIMSAIYWLFLSTKLTTDIDEMEIRISYFPFFKNKTIKWNDVKSAEMVTYGFVGYGIRWVGGKYGTVYNTSGHDGLFIIPNNNRKFVVGTQKRDELSVVVEKCLKNSNMTTVKPDHLSKDSGNSIFGRLD